MFWGFGSLFWSSLKSGQVSPQDTVGFLPSLKARFFFFFFSGCCFLSSNLRPASAVKNPAFLRPALCVRFFSAGPFRPCAVVFWVFRTRSAGGSLFSSLFLCLLVLFSFVWFLVRPHFANAPCCIVKAGLGTRFLAWPCWPRAADTRVCKNMYALLVAGRKFRNTMPLRHEIVFAANFAHVIK